MTDQLPIIPNISTLSPKEIVYQATAALFIEELKWASIKSTKECIKLSGKSVSSTVIREHLDNAKVYTLNLLKISRSLSEQLPEPIIKSFKEILDYSQERSNLSFDLAKKELLTKENNLNIEFVKINEEKSVLTNLLEKNQIKLENKSASYDELKLEFNKLKTEFKNQDKDLSKKEIELVSLSERKDYLEKNADESIKVINSLETSITQKRILHELSEEANNTLTSKISKLEADFESERTILKMRFNEAQEMHKRELNEKAELQKTLTDLSRSNVHLEQENQQLRSKLKGI